MSCPSFAWARQARRVAMQGSWAAFRAHVRRVRALRGRAAPLWRAADDARDACLHDRQADRLARLRRRQLDLWLRLEAGRDPRGDHRHQPLGDLLLPEGRAPPCQAGRAHPGVQLITELPGIQSEAVLLLLALPMTESQLFNIEKTDLMRVLREEPGFDESKLAPRSASDSASQAAGARLRGRGRGGAGATSLYSLLQQEVAAEASSPIKPVLNGGAAVEGGADHTPQIEEVRRGRGGGGGGGRAWRRAARRRRASLAAAQTRGGGGAAAASRRRRRRRARARRRRRRAAMVQRRRRRRRLMVRRRRWTGKRRRLRR